MINAKCKDMGSAGIKISAQEAKNMLDFHLQILQESLRILYDIKDEIKEKYGLPITVESYLKLKKFDIKVLDTLAYRFAKIQSILGERVFREILEELEYDLDGKSYLDILQAIEKEEIISSVFEWKRLREVRNTISHDYPEEIEFLVSAINEMLSGIEVFDEIIKNIKEKYEYANKIKSKRD